jgi:hypothetical protein
MDEQNLISVFEAIENAGYNGVGGFLDGLLASKDRHMKRRVSTLIENQLPSIIMQLLDHPRFARKAEHNQLLTARLTSWVIEDLMYVLAKPSTGAGMSCIMINVC